jgi:hypothetical protein
MLSDDFAITYPFKKRVSTGTYGNDDDNLTDLKDKFSASGFSNGCFK